VRHKGLCTISSFLLNATNWKNECFIKNYFLKVTNIVSFSFPSFLSFLSLYPFFMSRDSSVGIATRYGLDGPGIESRWGRDFTYPSISALGFTSLIYNGYWFLPRGNAVGAWRSPPTPSRVEVKERTELYICSSSGSLGHVLG
jgi:hypothetical protein